MGLIYKPNALYMTPKNESVDITNGIDFSFIFKGYQMSEAKGQLYQNSNIGEWTALGSSFEFAPSTNAPYYNNQNIVCHIGNSGAVYTNLTNNKNSTLGWGVTVYGMPSSQTADNNNSMTPAIKGFETGNRVVTTSGGSPYNYTYISSYDSKLTLGAVNSGEDAEGTDLTNTFTVTEGVYINLTTGDEIKESINATSYYIYKVNEGAQDPLAYYIKCYDTQAHAIAGGDTGVITGSTVQNKTYYVNPTATTSNIFYVGVLGGNKIQLFTTKEAALQGVSEAIVPLTNGTTYVIQAIEDSQVIQFIPIVTNTPFIDNDEMYPDSHIGLSLITGSNPIQYTYNIISGDNVTLYTGQKVKSDTGDIYYIRMINGNVVLYLNREAAFTEDNVYVTQFNSGASYLMLEEFLETTKNFVVDWEDNTDVPMISSWEAMLYNVAVDGSDNVISRTFIESSDTQYSADVQYQFSHLLLSSLSGINGEYSDELGRYEVIFNLIDNTGYLYSCNCVFDVGYAVTESDYSPVIVVDNCDSSVMVDWSNGLSIQGETDMSSVTYVDDYITDDNRAVVVNANKTISFDAPIPASCFPTFLFQPSSNFNGQIMALEGDDQNAVLSYDNSIDKFIFSVTNLNLGTTISTIVETDVQELESNKAYLIGYAEGKVYVREYATIS